MKAPRGMLALVCTLIVIGAAAVHLPVVSGLEELARSFSGEPREGSPLAGFFTPSSAPVLPTVSNAAIALTLHHLRSDHRPDEVIATLAREFGAPVDLLRAYLALASRGVLGPDGMYWIEVEGIAPSAAGRERMRAAVQNLAELQRATGSWESALLAEQAGVPRAARVRQTAGAGAGGLLGALRRRLLVPWRDDARNRLCQTVGLARALAAKLPVPGPARPVREGDGVRFSCQGGEPVSSPMDGRVEYAGQSPRLGRCLEIRHACELRTVLCGLQETSVKAGGELGAGDGVGACGPQGLWFGLRLDNQPLDPAGLALPSLDVPPPPSPAEIDPDHAEEQE
ncbi:MAG: M23 family metallopeptidase [Myxococcales bacterium]|nr:M23 family metallopeptidase [Myxococcales bacterium]